MRLNRHPGLKAQVYVACDKTKTMESKNLLQFPENCMHTAFAQHSKGIPRFSVRGSAAWGACQLCTLPLGHLCQCHQMTLLLPNVVLSGKFPFLMFLSWSHCSSKACFAPAKVGRFCLVPSAFLPAIVLAHLGHPVFSRALCVTAVYHSCKQAVNFLWALMWLWTVTWSGDNGWFFSANHNSATCGGFVANVSC